MVTFRGSANYSPLKLGGDALAQARAGAVCSKTDSTDYWAHFFIAIATNRGVRIVIPIEVADTPSETNFERR